MGDNLRTIIKQRMSLTELIFAVGSNFLGLLIIVYIIPSQVVVYDPSPPNARTFPYVISIIYLILSSIWLFNVIMGRRTEEHLIDTKSLLIGSFIAVIFICFSFLMQTIGYIIGGTSAVICVIFMINGFRKWGLFAFVGLFLTLVYYVFFTKVMKIELYSVLLSYLGN
jgi:hypothetical protein